ncbi:MAG: TonB-dependent receptor plug domain-containing protein, partial [Ginsengibacter sp.]
MKKILQSFILVAMVLLVTSAEAQQRTVTGTVTSPDDGSALAGVSVVAEGTTLGTTTDAQGNFSLNVPSNSQKLVFSSQGYTTQFVAIGSGSMAVILAHDIQQLSDVVVTALGIKRAEKSLTYAAQVVNASDLNVAKETNLINSLQGKVSGVVISRSATGPGGSSKVQLRGSRSITGGNEPLYIVDGVPLNTGRRASGGGDFGGRDGGGGISMLNPDNIESMTVLKGASAAALYGSAGQNGAIVITTKSGKSGKIQMEYDGGITTDKAFYLPKFQSEYGQGDGGIFNPNSEHSYGTKADGHEVTLWNGQKAPYTNHTDNMA